MQEDRHWVVDVDLAQFFDRVNHDILMGFLANLIADPRMLTLIRRYPEAGVMVTAVVVKRYDGTAGTRSCGTPTIAMGTLNRGGQRSACWPA
jgi:retron-type reverse transcriptase